MASLRVFIVCLLFALMVASGDCFSQAEQFQHITSEQGISQSEIYCFLEDSRGFMWFGTVDGLNRYDGYEVTIFNIDKDNPNSISNNTIRCLAEDDFGRIWIGTDDGLSVYDARTEQIHQLELTITRNDRLTVFTALISNGKLYIGTAMGLFALDVGEADWAAGDTAPPLIECSGEAGEYAIVASHSGPKGDCWFTTDNGLYRLAVPPDGTTPALARELNLEKTFPAIRNLAQDGSGNLWIVSHDYGFLRYRPETGEPQFFSPELPGANIPSNKASSVVLDNAGNLWIGTHNKGLLFLEKAALNDPTPRFEIVDHDPSNDRSLNSNLVYSLFVSKSNLLWVGTIGSGVNVFNPHRKAFHYYNLHNAANPSSSRTNFTRSVYADPTGEVWVGTHNNGLFLCDREDNEQTKKIGFGTESVFHINAADNAHALVCTGQGVSLVRRTASGLDVRSALPIGPSFYTTRPQNGVFWVATLKGLRQCRLTNGTITLERTYDTSTSPALSFDNCRVVSYQAGTGKLLVGTEGGGLNVLSLDEDMNPTGNTVYRKEDDGAALSNNYVRSIISTSPTEVWVGTYEGLNKMTIEPQTGRAAFTTYTRKDGLPNNMIQSIVKDREGRLWIGTNQGLCRLDPTTATIALYTLSDGIQSNEFSEHAVFIRPNGEVIIGGVNGINTFYPEDIVAEDVRPNTTLTDFYLFNERVRVGEEAEGGGVPLEESIIRTESIELSADQRSFGFGFSAMVYSAPEKVRYAYRLEGFDEGWTLTDARNRRAGYTNLPYGDYTFMVKATDGDGEWEAIPRAVKVTIQTPLYLSTAAFVVYGLLGLLAIVFFTNYTILRHTTKNKIVLENLHNKRVRELEEMRTQFFINVSHDLRTPLTLISSPLDLAMEDEKLLPETRGMLDLVAGNVRKLKDLTEQLLDIRKGEADKMAPQLRQLDLVAFVREEAALFRTAFAEKGVELLVLTDEQQTRLGFDPDMISKVIFNLLSNALKHTESGEVSIRISCSKSGAASAEGDDFVQVAVRDTGSGIAPEDLPQVFDRFYQGGNPAGKGYGIGLSHCQAIVLAHGGRINAASTPGEGSTFSFYLPARDAATTPADLRPPMVAMPADETIEEDDALDRETHILVVEDNPELRAFISNALGRKYTVHQANDGEQGLRMADELFPDLILSDVMMPNMNGIEFCRRIKSNVRTSHLPVILLTAKVGREAEYAGLEIGADEYISKPFELRYLFLKIRNLLQSRNRLRELFKTSTALEPSQVTVTSIDEHFLKELIAEIEGGIPDSDFSIKVLEQSMGMSHASFYNKVKSLTGQSAKELIFSFRMKRARQILEDTANIRVAEVADLVGFTDPKYFSKRFKEYFGISPSEVGK